METLVEEGLERMAKEICEELAEEAVHYVENALMNSLFGLAFWEQIFTPVPGAFHNPFQSVPTDMYSPDFRVRRREAIAARLNELRAGAP